MQADILREKFLEFFKSRKHKIAESDSLVPKDDPTVLFTPAGMNQFKKEFLGFDSGFKRAATSQRCLRTDDLDKVGKTSGHHTFFEMLGNFSFGDYFKKDAICWAWEFLTRELGISQDLLWVSVYKDDGEAYDIWKNTIKIPSERIVKLGDKENFWPSEAKEKGPNGPCGPCSEIFFDLGKSVGCGNSDCSPACGCGRFLEVWNLVFTQFNRLGDGKLEPLPNKNIDTGMGLERLAAVMQGKRNNFETDLFVPLIHEINDAAGLHALESKKLMCAIADHLRAVVFSIYDGVLPSNEARGYVVRKLIRKSVLALRAVGISQPFLHKLVPVLAQVMARPYPDITARQENIAQIILSEEKHFISTLSSSSKIFKDKFAKLGKKSDADVVGATVFQLYDTYGIPVELTEAWLSENGIAFSRKAFDRHLHLQKSRSKEQSTMKGDVFSSAELDYGIKTTKFLGYAIAANDGMIRKIMLGNQPVKSVKAGQEAVIILDESVFYPESGGQVGDVGEIIKGKNRFIVLDTRKAGSVILHFGRVVSGVFKQGTKVAARVDVARRLAVARNHTATHLLQAALRKVLGGHVQQQGSLVAAERLRFDFTHFQALSREELDRVEEVVNGFILNNVALKAKQMPLKEAKKSGALAFFGEKYGEKVRVVSVLGVSNEFCAGTHLDSTGEIGLFKIVQECSVASGVRRIEAVTGLAAYALIKEQERLLGEIQGAFGVSRERLITEIAKRSARLKELEKELQTRKLDTLRDVSGELLQAAQIINGTKTIISQIDGLDMNLLRTNVDILKKQAHSAVIALGSVYQGRALLVVGVTDDLCQQGFDAQTLVRAAGSAIGGSGGGRKDFAQAGGNNTNGFVDAFRILKDKIGERT